VTEMHASLKHLAHGDISHRYSPVFGLGLHVPHDSNPVTGFPGCQGTLLHVTVHVWIQGFVYTRPM
jgi:hypothetical protein